jgi:hypothetical protein
LTRAGAAICFPSPNHPVGNAASDLTEPASRLVLKGLKSRRRV